MLKLRGSDPETVLIPDLNDKVYYGQEKIFSETQYSKSNDLKREIKKGRLIVISRTPESFGGYATPDPIELPKQDTLLSNTDSNGISAGMLEKFEILLNKVESLEAKVSNRPTESTVNIKEEVISALKDLKSPEEPPKPNIDHNSSELKVLLGELLRKVDNISSTPQEVKPLTEDFGSKDLTRRVDEVYVPNIRVEDAKSHVNLDVRVIEQKDSIRDSLNLLKSMKNG